MTRANNDGNLMGAELIGKGKHGRADGDAGPSGRRASSATPYAAAVVAVTWDHIDNENKLAQSNARVTAAAALSPPHPTDHPIANNDMHKSNNNNNNSATNESNNNSTANESPNYNNTIMIPSESDILMSAPGDQSSYHPGNIFYRNFVDERKEVYKKIKRGDKAKFCHELVRVLTVEKGLRLLRPSQCNRGWIVLADKSLAAKKVMSRMYQPNSIINVKTKHIPIIVPVTCAPQFPPLSNNRDPKSFVMDGFMGQHELGGCIVKIFDNLFLHPSHGPATAGHGISLCCDSPRGNKPTLNIDRVSYFQNRFGKDVMPTNKPNTVRRATYGTGSGIGSYGTPLG